MSGVEQIDDVLDVYPFSVPDGQETIADRFVDPHTFSRLRFSPILLTGFLLGLLREHFGNPHSIVEPVLQAYVWRNAPDTGILIEPNTGEVFKNMQQRPALLVKRNAIKNERLGIDDKIMTQGGVRGGEDFITSLHGSHTVFCISSRAAHAELLANEVAAYLLTASPVIRGSFRFDGDFKFEELGELRMVAGAGGQYVVPVTFSYIVVHVWRVASGAPLIRHIDVNVLLTT
jgi:hypothetical protein